MRHYSEKVCCCIPARVGAIMMALVNFCVYITTIALLFHYRQEFTEWSTSQQDVGTPLTLEAFNNVFIFFVSLFCAYAATSFLGLIALGLQHKKSVRIYHVANWFFVLLIFTISVAFWTYFKVKKDDYINDCQEAKNINTNAMADPFYTPIQLPRKQIVAGGSDKSECINLIKSLVIGFGVFMFIFNFIQLYWARSIGKYATLLKRNYYSQSLKGQELFK